MVKTAKLRLEGMPKSSVKDALEGILSIQRVPIFDNEDFDNKDFDNEDISYSNKKHMESYLNKVQKGLNPNQKR